jgi:hypothetical protein
MWISLTWTVLTGIVIAACLVLSLPGMVVFGVCTVMIFVGITIIARLYLVKSRAMSHNEKSRNVLFGFGRMVLWEPTEGVVFLKNKQVQAVDNNPNDGGGNSNYLSDLGRAVESACPADGPIVRIYRS